MHLILFALLAATLGNEVFGETPELDVINRWQRDQFRGHDPRRISELAILVLDGFGKRLVPVFDGLSFVVFVGDGSPENQGLLLGDQSL